MSQSGSHLDTIVGVGVHDFEKGPGKIILRFDLVGEPALMTAATVQMR